MLETRSRPRWRRAAAALMLLAPLLGALPANATTGPACPPAADVPPRALVGLWRAEFDAGLPGATLLLEPHPRHAGSLAGEVNRGGQRSRVVADLDDGEFTLEESADGVRIAATWLGDLVDGSCGREVRGRWQPQDGRPAVPFRLQRLGDR